MKQSLTPRYVVHVVLDGSKLPITPVCPRSYAVIDTLTPAIVAVYRMHEFAYRHASGLNSVEQVREVTR